MRYQGLPKPSLLHFCEFHSIQQKLSVWVFWARRGADGRERVIPRKHRPVCYRNGRREFGCLPLAWPCGEGNGKLFPGEVPSLTINDEPGEKCREEWRGVWGEESSPPSAWSLSLASLLMLPLCVPEDESLSWKTKATCQWKAASYLCWHFTVYRTLAFLPPLGSYLPRAYFVPGTMPIFFSDISN